MPRGGATLEQKLKTLKCPDFSGCLNSEADPHDLQPNESPDCENVRFLPGRVLGRDGYVVRVAAMSADGDGAFFFYDRGGSRRLVTFANGNVYDETSFTSTLVKSSAYTAGNRITADVLNGILYFSDGVTVNGGSGGIRYYDPVGSTSDTPLLTTSGSGGTIAPPACKLLRVYAGCLVMANLTYVGGSTAPHAVLWSNVNDPTTIVGTNIFQVGAGQGGEINALEAMGVASVGISPFRALFVGKSEMGVYMLKGAMTVSDLSEVLINCPVGVKDGATAKFIPGPDGSGYIVWLATDRQVWYTNGVISEALSKQIKTELAQAVADRVSANSEAKFTAVRSYSDYHYILDTGTDVNGNNYHYVYNWDMKGWTRYKGFPTGYWVEAKDGSSQDVIYCADSSSRLCQANIGTTDNEASISPYYKSGWLNAGDSTTWKIWKWLYVGFKTNSGSLDITARVDMGRGEYATATLTPETYDTSDNTLIWDVGNWDEADWAAGGGASYTPYFMKTRLAVEVSALDGSKWSLGGKDCQITIANSTITPSAHFEVLGFDLLYLQKGRKRVA